MTAADNGMSSLKLMGLVHVRSRNEYFVWGCSNLTEINDHGGAGAHPCRHGSILSAMEFPSSFGARLAIFTAIRRASSKDPVAARADTAQDPQTIDRLHGGAMSVGGSGATCLMGRVVFI
jgi:hypothetical protein